MSGPNFIWLNEPVLGFPTAHHYTWKMEWKDGTVQLDVACMTEEEGEGKVKFVCKA